MLEWFRILIILMNCIQTRVQLVQLNVLQHTGPSLKRNDLTLLLYPKTFIRYFRMTVGRYQYRDEGGWTRKRGRGMIDLPGSPPTIDHQVVPGTITGCR